MVYVKVPVVAVDDKVDTFVQVLVDDEKLCNVYTLPAKGEQLPVLKVNDKGEPIQVLEVELTIVEIDIPMETFIVELVTEGLVETNRIL